MYTHTLTHTRTHTHTHTHLHTRKHTHTRIHTRTHAHTHSYRSNLVFATFSQLLAKSLKPVLITRSVETENPKKIKTQVETQISKLF